MTFYYDLTVSLRNGLNTGIQKVVKSIALEIHDHDFKVVAGVRHFPDRLVIVSRSELLTVFRQNTNSNIPVFFKLIYYIAPTMRSSVLLLNKFKMSRDFINFLKTRISPNSLFEKKIQLIKNNLS